MKIHFQKSTYSIPIKINTYLKYVWSGFLNKNTELDFVFLEDRQFNTLGNNLYIGSDLEKNKNLKNLGGDQYTFYSPEVALGDFNQDQIADLVVYDAGIYDWQVRMNFGTTPVLFLGDSSGNFIPTSKLEDAIKKLVTPKPENFRSGVQIDTTIGIKDIDVADIDKDGDLDIWVESTGSKNMTSHFMINNNGEFQVDLNNRISREFLFGPLSSDYYRYGMARFIDVNDDGFVDLAAGQIRDNDVTHVNQSSFIFINDKTGFFKNSIRLPLPDFYFGFTAVKDILGFDINKDGLKDLVITHTRNDDVTGPLTEPAWSGTYFQVLIQASPLNFVDKTSEYIKDQSEWSNFTKNLNQHAIGTYNFDLDNNGFDDLVINYGGWKDNQNSPNVLLNFFGTTFTPSFLDSTEAKSNYSYSPLLFNQEKAFNFYRVAQEANGSLVSLYSDYSISGSNRQNFLGKTTAFDLDGNAGKAYRIYKAAFDRTPDTAGLGYWIAQMDKGMSLTEAAARFVDSNEFRTLYGTNPTNEQFLTKLYQNVLGRDPEATGYNWWLNELNTNPSKTKAKALADFAESGENQAGVDSLIGSGITYEPWVG
jgi:hypothetical protein